MRPRVGSASLVALGMLALLATGCAGPATRASPSVGPVAPPTPAGDHAGLAGTGSSSTEQALIPTHSAYPTTSASSAPWWMAQEGGYFREQGLAVDLQFIAGGVTLNAALAKGDLDVIAAGGQIFVLGYLQGLETMIIGSTAAGVDTTIVARPEIQTLDDLRGRTIAVTRLKALTDIAARAGLERYGLRPDVDVSILATGGPAESLAAMESGVVAGASLGMPALLEARKRGYREVLDVTRLGIPFMGAAVGATKRLLAERPMLAERYLRALAQAASRLRTDREFAMQVIGKYTNTTDRELLGATVDYYQPLYKPDLYPEPAAVQTVLDAEENPAARTVHPEDVIDTRFAERLRTSGFLDALPR
ncbi:MAG TPA: ABC transporter substrate-binding protein [Chloroflexota bacterium]|nr:ABC transporter substrate-binding protein [Chloroflexota bacterium]